MHVTEREKEESRILQSADDTAEMEEPLREKKRLTAQRGLD